MKKYFLFPFVIIFIISACSSVVEKEYTNKKGQWVVEEWYNQSNLKSRTTFITSDSSEYIFCSYYENGELHDSSRFVNEQAEGLRKFFDRTGDLLHIENYSKGLLNGPHKALYSNGVSSFEGYHIQENKVGEWIFHYPDGKPITYEFYDSIGRLLYFRKYVTNSNQPKGSAILGISVLQNDMNNDTVILSVMSANPPGCAVNLEISNKNKSKLFNQQISSIHTICPISLKELGNTHLEVKIDIIDSELDEVENYKTDFEFIKH